MSCIGFEASLPSMHQLHSDLVKVTVCLVVGPIQYHFSFVCDKILLFFDFYHQMTTWYTLGYVGMLLFPHPLCSLDLVPSSLKIWISDSDSPYQIAWFYDETGFSKRDELGECRDAISVVSLKKGDFGLLVRLCARVLAVTLFRIFETLFLLS